MRFLALTVLSLALLLTSQQTGYSRDRGVQGAPKTKHSRFNKADAVEYIERVVKAAEAMSPPTPAAVEKLLDVSLGPPGSLSLKGKPRTGPFSEVEFREPGRNKSYGLWIFTFVLRDGLHLKREDFDSQFIGPSYGINLHRLPEPTVRHSIERNGGSIHFVFWAHRDTLESVAVQRNIVPPDFE
jgi:hypothetical protein